jgi:hypothetical protein
VHDPAASRISILTTEQLCLQSREQGLEIDTYSHTFYITQKRIIAGKTLTSESKPIIMHA